MNGGIILTLIGGPGIVYVKERCVLLLPIGIVEVVSTGLELAVYEQGIVISSTLELAVCELGIVFTEYPLKSTTCKEHELLMM